MHTFVTATASPGRILDHLENTKGFNLKALKFLVCAALRHTWIGL